MRKQRLNEAKLLTKVRELSVSRAKLLAMTLIRQEPHRAKLPDKIQNVQLNLNVYLLYLLNLGILVEGPCFGFMCPHLFGKQLRTEENFDWNQNFFISCICSNKLPSPSLCLFILKSFQVQQNQAKQNMVKFISGVLISLRLCLSV